MNVAEGVQIVSFGILAAMAIGAALGVVLLSNIVYSAFLLGGVFISMAGMYLLLNADFVAAAQVLIYVGSVNVLILFAIMLVNKQEDFQPMKRGWFRTGATAVVCVGLFALLGTMVISTGWSISPHPAIGETTLRIGKHFFSDFLLPFELASVLLLIAMIGSIVLARRDFIVEDTLPETEKELVFKLPERPREVVGSSSDSSQN
ncbi:MAG TPA: NADH-quinone oxidoreductase subunit J [Oscillatoriales cyanobacterium M59_W2019_021]|nr:MAG: NADH-quinone oxidoreductase subunit J [Cyanobacteria bacterium J055]HIK31585.1 NADH-quinone oxidoreductase subunit J [Oscillatoriales cyanobacterium M4454_W2019_049]HIK50984.1 NADH-quinone oxidoreductase subunit J [Oscillatoriales cyanobacterium M59_W2019_021]